MRKLWVGLVLLLSVACAIVPQETGILGGHVTVGPSLPASREGVVEPTPDPRVYASREIVIYAENGRREVARAQIDAAGNYHVALPAGTYLVDINHVGVDQGIDLPQAAEVVSGQATRLDIVIDTGVR